MTGPPPAVEARDWIAQHWDPDLALDDWRGQLVDSGWGCPAWPREWFGRDLSAADAAAVSDELARAGAVGVATGVGMSLAAPTILAHGSDAVKARLLRPLATGAHKWCQLFSEPGSGSDLASLSSRAERDGDEWIVNGQKVWNSGAQRAQWGLLLARTDATVPKHQGITCFALPMQQPGVEVRPLRQMNGHASFNEVFLTDARVSDHDRIGDVGAGWTVALTTLAHERSLAASIGAALRVMGGTGRAAREAAEEAAEYWKTYEWYPQRAGRPELVASEIARRGLSDDPIVRQHAARVELVARTARWSAQRAQSARAAGRAPGPEGSIAKLLSSAIARTSARAHSAIAGADAMLTGSDSALGGVIAEIIVSVPAQSIAGGTDEIQHNILGERVLGLPREPQPDQGA
jgi:alkylation response protein AidB-like acyl-CoA dehydrogenase